MPLFFPSTLIFIVHLKNFPQWAIPMTRIVPVFNVDDAWNVKEINFTSRFQYWWRKIDDTTWDIYIQLFGEAFIDGHSSPPDLIPLYLNVDLVIVNEHIYQEVDTTRT